MLLAIAQKLDSLGMRPLVASVASLVYRGQRFSVAPDGMWVNHQPECTIVSRELHTQRFADFSAWAAHHWLHCYTPKQGDIIVDVGAGMGEEAVFFSRLVGPTGHVFSIEAHPQTFACLEGTILRSGLANVTPIHCALADADGEALIGDDGWLANSILRGGKIAVPQRTLESLTHEFEIDHIDFLRMNIEGAERLAVRGLGGVEIRNLAISCHDFCGLPSKAQVHAALEAMDYVVTTRQGEPDAPWIGDYLYGRTK
jgi:FkbM family methyltransferase